jgi:hypothetical protein
MSELTDKLDFIMLWLDSINPDPNLHNFNCYKKGLEQTEIDDLSEELPFKLPEEIYQLYQWRNGVDFNCRNFQESSIFLFPEYQQYNVPLEFISLQVSIQRYKQLREISLSMRQSFIEQNIDTDFEYWNINWLPIGAFQGDSFLYADCSTEIAKISQFEAENIQRPLRTYKSLTAYFSTLAECCELNVYQVIQNEYEDEITIGIDETKLELEKAIFRKYNL